jgi:hypothetical protein
MNRRHFVRLFVASSIGCSLAGCAVSPTPLGEVEIGSKAADQLSRVTAGQEPVVGAIDLYEAMARALKYNLDHRVEVMDAALRMRELDLSHYSLLPTVVANSGYAARDNFAASSSYNILNFDADAELRRFNLARKADSRLGRYL